jgi:hypothetical protein
MKQVELTERQKQVLEAAGGWEGISVEVSEI